MLYDLDPHLLSSWKNDIGFSTAAKAVVENNAKIARMKVSKMNFFTLASLPIFFLVSSQFLVWILRLSFIRPFFS